MWSGSYVGCLSIQLCEAVSPYSYVRLSLHTAMWGCLSIQLCGLSLHTAMWVGLSLHTAMWAVSPYSYVAHTVSPYSYVGLSLHTAMWGCLSIQLCGAVSPYSYVGLSLHTAMWGCLSIQLCGAVSPYSYVGLLLHTSLSPTYAAYHHRTARTSGECGQEKESKAPHKFSCPCPEARLSYPHGQVSATPILSPHRGGS